MMMAFLLLLLVVVACISLYALYLGQSLRLTCKLPGAAVNIETTDTKRKTTKL